MTTQPKITRTANVWDAPRQLWGVSRFCAVQSVVLEPKSGTPPTTAGGRPRRAPKVPYVLYVPFPFQLLDMTHIPLGHTMPCFS